MTRTASAAIRAMQPIEWRHNAYLAISAALRAGVLSQPSACERCGLATSSLVTHHEDYRKPFDVLWLCAKCHGWHHRPLLRTIGFLRARNGRVVSDHDYLMGLMRRMRRRVA